MKIIWSLLAIERVSEVAAYIAQDNVRASQKWVDDVFDFVIQLERFPESGRHLPEVTRPDIRELLFGNYRIVYKVKAKGVDILTVKHSKQILPVEEIETLL